jgi:hypothetical protein
MPAVLDDAAQETEQPLIQYEARAVFYAIIYIHGEG